MRATESDVPHQICTKRIHWIQISIKFNTKDNLFMRFVARQYWHVWQKKGPTNALLPLCKSLDGYVSGCCRRIDVCDNKSKRYTISCKQNWIVNNYFESKLRSKKNVDTSACMTQRFAAYIHPTHCDSFITKFIYNLCDILQQRKWVHKIAMHQPSTESSNVDESDRIQSGYMANIVYLVLVDFSSNLSICIRIARRASTWDNFHEK